VLFASAKSCPSGQPFRASEDVTSSVIITRAEKGMILFAEIEKDIPTYAKEIYDVTGAGDTAIAALSLAIASSAFLEEAAIIANHTAGITVSRAGTYRVSLSELKRQISCEEGKIRNFEDLTSIADDLRRKGKKIVWTNGCFDILHEGHIDYLKKAKKLGDCLILGINSDESIKSLKCQGRPIMPGKARAEIISSLEFVDYVIIFPEQSTEKYIGSIKPDVYIKGEDYNVRKVNSSL